MSQLALIHGRQRTHGVLWQLVLAACALSLATCRSLTMAIEQGVVASGDPTPEGDYARRQNAHALSLSLFVCMLVPWAFCFLSYTGALFSYPRCVAEHWSLFRGVFRFSTQCAFMTASLGAGIVHWHCCCRDKAVANRFNKRQSRGSEGDLYSLATTAPTMRRRPSDILLTGGWHAHAPV